MLAARPLGIGEQEGEHPGQAFFCLFNIIPGLEKMMSFCHPVCAVTAV